MANKDNPRRKGAKRAEHGPRWEGPETDRNSARSRTKWKARKNRALRRVGTLGKYQGLGRPDGRASKKRGSE